MLDEEGKVYTWGKGNYGVLGTRTTDKSNVPICISEIEGHILQAKKL